MMNPQEQGEQQILTSYMPTQTTGKRPPPPATSHKILEHSSDVMLLLERKPKLENSVTDRS